MIKHIYMNIISAETKINISINHHQQPLPMSSVSRLSLRACQAERGWGPADVHNIPILYIYIL